MTDFPDSPDTSVTVYGPTSVLKGAYPIAKIDELCSFFVEGAEFSAAYKKKVWDGRKRLFNKRTGAFPTGLLDDVLKALDEESIYYSFVDKRIVPGRRGVWDAPSYELKAPWKLRDYQLRAVKAAVDKGCGIIDSCTSSGKSVIAASIVYAQDVTSLVLVPSRELLHQLRATFLSAIPGATEESIGIVGDSEWQPGTFCTIATVSTLYARLDTEECQEFLKSIELVIADEVHQSGADGYYEVLTSCQAYYRYGMSGTPYDRTDGATLRLIACFGDRIAKIGYKELVEAKVIPKASIIFDKITTPILPKKPKLTYPQAYSQLVVNNTVLTERVVEWTKAAIANNLSVCILVDQIAQGKNIDEALWSTDGPMISHAFVQGSDSGDTRSQSLIDFENRQLPVLIATSIFDTGISLNSLDVLILAGSKKSKIRSIQRLGRALRGTKAIVVDFLHLTNDYLLGHSRIRYKDYKEQDCFPIRAGKPSAKLIKEVWDSQDG